MQKMRNKEGLSGYGTTFRKMGSTLNNQIEDSDEEDLEPGASMNGRMPAALTDEELLRACGGRTAHK